MKLFLSIHTVISHRRQLLKKCKLAIKDEVLEASMSALESADADSPGP